MHGTRRHSRYYSTEIEARQKPLPHVSGRDVPEGTPHGSLDPHHPACTCPHSTMSRFGLATLSASSRDIYFCGSVVRHPCALYTCSSASLPCLLPIFASTPWTISRSPAQHPRARPCPAPHRERPPRYKAWLRLGPSLKMHSRSSCLSWLQDSANFASTSVNSVIVCLTPRPSIHSSETC